MSPNPDNSSEKAVHAILEAIRAGQLVPGQRLLIPEWSKRLEIGNHTLRIAFQQLHHEGLLSRSSRHGSFLADVGDFSRVFDLYIELGCIAACNAAERAHASDILSLRILVSSSHLKRHRDIATVSTSLHRAIWSLADNTYLEALLIKTAKQLDSLAMLLKCSSRRESSFNVRAAAGHLDALLKAFKRRDRHDLILSYKKNTLLYFREHLDMDSIFR